MPNEFPAPTDSERFETPSVNISPVGYRRLGPFSLMKENLTREIHADFTGSEEIAIAFYIGLLALGIIGGVIGKIQERARKRERLRVRERRNDGWSYGVRDGDPHLDAEQWHDYSEHSAEYWNRLGRLGGGDGGYGGSPSRSGSSLPSGQFPPDSDRFPQFPPDSDRSPRFPGNSDRDPRFPGNTDRNPSLPPSTGER